MPSNRNVSPLSVIQSLIIAMTRRFLRNAFKKEYALYWGAGIVLLLTFWNIIYYDPVPERPEHVEAYIERFGPVAKKLSRDKGVPAPIILAVSCLESSWGESELASNGNNYFGIKAKAKPSYCKLTNEYVRRKRIRIKACFKAYESAEDSFHDFGRMISQEVRYQPLFQFRKSDYSKWAKGLQEQGYATDPRYAKKLIRVIEKYRLDRI